MVVAEESRSHLLRGSLGRCRSDDNIELFVDANVPIPLVEKSSIRRARIFGRLRQKVANRVRSKKKGSFYEEKKDDTSDDIEDKENSFFPSPSPVTINLSSYDERSILENRDGPPEEEDEPSDSNSVSSVLSTESNQKSQHRLVAHWKSCMSSSIRKVMRREVEDEMKGKPARYRDFGLYVNPKESMFQISKEPKRSAFSLLLPTLETPPASQDEASQSGQYNNEDDFPLKSLDAIAVEEAKLQKEISEKGQAAQRPFLQPKESNQGIFVSFDDDMAQLIFDVPSADDVEDFRAVDVQSVVSDNDSFFDEEDEFRVTFPSYMVGAEFSHPGLPSIAPSSSVETEGSARPLGISCGHPNANRHHVDAEVWSNMDTPLLDGEVTDPPSPIPVNKSREDYWTLGQVYSNESDLTMTDVLLNKHGCFPTEFASALPEIPLPRNPQYPFDEDPDQNARDNLLRRKTKERAVSTGIERYLARTTVKVPEQDSWRTGTQNYTEREVTEAPFDENTNRGNQVHRRPEQARTTSMQHFLQKGAMTAFAIGQDQERHDRDQERYDGSFRDHVRRGKMKCGCVKCAAKSIYQDLLKCNGESVE